MSDKPIFSCAGCLIGLMLACGIFAGADHVSGHNDTLGLLSEAFLSLGLTLLGGLIGRAAA